MVDIRDLVIFSKFPKARRSKTRLGKELVKLDIEDGYERSAKLSQFLLEDLVETASQVCNVTVASPNTDSNSDAESFRNKYPKWNIFGGDEDISPRVAEFIGDKYSQGQFGKLLIMCGDIALGKDEIDSWYGTLNKKDLLVGIAHSLNGGILHLHQFLYHLQFTYQLGFSEEFLQDFAEHLYQGQSHFNRLIEGLITISKHPRVGFTPMKSDVDTLSDLQKLLMSDTVISEKTRDYSRELLNRAGYVLSPKYTL